MSSAQTVFPRTGRLPSVSGRLVATAILVTVLAAANGRFVLHQFHAILGSAGSKFSLLSLCAAGLVAVFTIVARRCARGRRLNLRLLPRALFPGWLVRHASTRADLGFFVLNALFMGTLIGSTFLSFPFAEHAFSHLLTALFGPANAAPAASNAAAGLETVILYLAFELAYYIDHYTSHRFDVFWEIHRVHHTAEVLTPLTVFRVHPLEEVKYHHIQVAVLALSAAILGRWLPEVQWTLNGTNVLIVIVYLTLTHLQHSHLWLPTTGLLGRIIASPAHHQMHHSDDPAYARCNLGWSLAVFDWMFGTLRVPGRTKGRLRFGTDSGPADNHSIKGALVTPIVRAVRALG
jgi:sterol desaturase/sphingolipid hydroxylase (fatty acid hydroxylase superfamily)